MFAYILRTAAWLSLLVFPVGIIATRLGVIHFRDAFGYIFYSAILAAVVVALSILLLLFRKKLSPSLASAARSSFLVALIPVAVLGYQYMQIQTLPKIHNISTDVVTPPEFVEVANLRSTDHNPLSFDPSTIKAQQAAYPEVTTLVLDRPADAVFADALALVKESGWTLVSADQESGLIEATETTLLWGFKDDVVIRVMLADESTRVDMRSVSRVGLSDIGANARRITEFLAALSEA